MEEFQESDVLWQEQPAPPEHLHHDGYRRRRHGRCQKQHHQQREGDGRAVGSSAPVGIPGVRFSGDDYGAAAAFVPPHEMIAARRRCSEEKAASSVCVGHGRTLKGRDLRSVRTAVLRLTGFLEC